MELVFNEFRDRFLLFFESLGDRFSDFLALETGLKTKVISIPNLSHEGGPRQLVHQIAAAMARSTHNEQVS